MARPKLDSKDIKIRLSITISPDISLILDKVTKNKSAFIEKILKKEFKIKNND